MAETLGSLTDKLSIVDLKLWHCQEMLYKEDAKLEYEEELKLIEKNNSLLEQRSKLIHEIDEWIIKAIDSPESVQLSFPQNKIYGRFRKEEK
jgi:hypothetical protein